MLIGHLSSLLSRYVSGVRIEDIEVAPIKKSSFKKGNKTRTYKLLIKDYEGYPNPGFTVSLPMSYALKEDKDETHFKLRKAVDSTCNKEPLKPHRYSAFFGATAGTFPFFWSELYEPFNNRERLLTLTTYVSEKSLDDKVEEIIKSNQNSKITDIDSLKPANNPKIVIHEKLPLYEEDITRHRGGTPIVEPDLEKLTKIYMKC